MITLMEAGASLARRSVAVAVTTIGSSCEGASAAAATAGAKARKIAPDRRRAGTERDMGRGRYECDDIT
ncbi:hypothetical protein SGMN_22530 [Stenotrophomonas geniculata]